eukprot:14825705-Alexandrium_andersonii.AAC.1
MERAQRERERSRRPRARARSNRSGGGEKILMGTPSAPPPSWRAKKASKASGWCLEGSRAAP